LEDDKPSIGVGFVCNNDKRLLLNEKMGMNIFRTKILIYDEF
jgi:hypothetical protein